MINEKEILPNIMELKLERFNYCSHENIKKDGNKMFLKNIHLYSKELIKISNADSYIFTTEEALKLMLHINTFENYKFDINNKYCSSAYKLILRAIKDFEEVKDVFSFFSEEDCILKIKCLANGMVFPVNNVQTYAIRDYMKYYTLECPQYSPVVESYVEQYIPLRKVLFRYRIRRILKVLHDEFVMNADDLSFEEEFFAKCREMYNILKDRKITNSYEGVSINLLVDENTGAKEIYIYGKNTIIPNQNLDLDGWLNANIGRNDIYMCALCLEEIVMTKYYNKKSKIKLLDNNESNLEDEIGRENLLNMLEP